MFIRRLYDHNLAQASYLIGSTRGGGALVVDPNRKIEQYVAAAEQEGVRILVVTETHIHADFVSGSRDLAQQTGATLYLSDASDAGWKYAFAESSRAHSLVDGSSFTIGEIRVDVLHTPGHTPEHLSFLITNTAVADSPMGAITGDFIFVGDAGRPDLLERAAGQQGTMDGAARTLFKSLQRFKSQSDYLQIWPGHGAGSACGKALGAMPQSTLGYERLFNWGLAETDEEEFVRRVLTGQPEPPAYFALMKSMNRDGPPTPKTVTPRDIPAGELAVLLRSCALVVDARPAADYALCHAAGTINIPYDKSFLTWAGALLPYDRPIFLIAPRNATGNSEIAGDLSLIGLDNVEGTSTVASMDQIQNEGVAVESIRQIGVDALADGFARNDVLVIDVRAVHEFDEGHIPGALNLPLVSLSSSLAKLSNGRAIAVHCQGGNRRQHPTEKWTERGHYRRWLSRMGTGGIRRRTNIELKFNCNNLPGELIDHKKPMAKRCLRHDRSF